MLNIIFDSDWLLGIIIYGIVNASGIAHEHSKYNLALHHSWPVKYPNTGDDTLQHGRNIIKA